MKGFYYDFYMDCGQGMEYSFTAKTIKEKEDAIEEIKKHDLPYPYTIKKQSIDINIK